MAAFMRSMIEMSATIKLMDDVLHKMVEFVIDCPANKSDYLKDIIRADEH